MRVKEYGVAVVGLESLHWHFHLVGLEQDLKREVHQEIELLVVQTGKDSESFSTLGLRLSVIRVFKSPSYLSSAS